MDLEKLKQLDNQNEQNRKKIYEDKMNIPVKEWNMQLDSERFETKLQEELENELVNGKRLSIIFTIARDYLYDSGKSSIKLYGQYVDSPYYIIGVGFYDTDDYVYDDDELTNLAKSMYNTLKNKLNDLGFIITQEDGKLEVSYRNQSEIKLYLKVK